VAGGIACYKAAELVRLLVQDGFAVRVIMTKAAAEFVTPLTFQTLAGYPVATDLLVSPRESEISHINLADQADLLVVAPATANIIGKIAGGIADDLLTTVILATTAPVLLVPAMNVHMYENRILQQNIKSSEIWATIQWSPLKAISLAAMKRGRLRSPRKSWNRSMTCWKKGSVRRKNLDHRRPESRAD
jgi:phosphopantothenoylcysteine synthetase/decarboxylase